MEMLNGKESKKFCCLMMDSNLNSTCEMHPSRKDCPDALISFHPSSNDYRLMIHDGGSSGISINYCPWCGSALYSA